MANLVQELNSLDFSVYIGGPMQAAIKAQHDASMSQVNFIKEVGFEGTGATSKLRYVDFVYKKTVPNPAQGNETPVQSQVTLSVPLLSMLTIPALRIDEMTIDFNAKLNSVETQNVSSEFQGSASLSAKFWKVKFNASASYKKTTSSTSTTEKTYTLGVHVKAVNDELPAGLARIMDMLEDAIVATAAPVTP
ncbi:DUF2589 domain-containing protein [Chryseobacterium indologenes]|uniref:DUF2589 domain-containing protein n=1 Tax=Chryseobacterium indologenes TaxID=253 RepID=A0A1Z3W6P5_CHRID|nr:MULTISPECIES: DUF2589 domain-containing protein [Chryseobacterium]ASE63440.1 DUF2589 domain-containing protein [Chryseobacterium indologenes]ATN07435.1 DUF2589 domain-containing protein [Chryseobacterium indologenes]AYY83827.1 DUF2589 domain-containing protein [Chryseobacterium indologenes]AYZ37644.1 DUF2589 domain-containing protein [Chryseobacterium indologenes]AZB19154.1 DUF2589 domain-containing protein [Chryseobacterium indologenes]